MPCRPRGTSHTCGLADRTHVRACMFNGRERTSHSTVPVQVLLVASFSRSWTSSRVRPVHHDPLIINFPPHPPARKYEAREHRIGSSGYQRHFGVPSYGRGLKPSCGNGPT